MSNRRGQIDYSAYAKMANSPSAPSTIDLGLACLPATSIEESESRFHELEERIAIQMESWEAEAGLTGKTTTERAILALNRPERFSGEWECAHAWLKTDPDARVFSKVTK